MRYVVDIPPEVAQEINIAVKAGRYKSPQDFLVAAAQNQIYLETADVQGGSLQSQQTVTVASPRPRSSEDKLYRSATLYLNPMKLLSFPENGAIKTVSLTKT